MKKSIGFIVTGSLFLIAFVFYFNLNLSAFDQEKIVKLRTISKRNISKSKKDEAKTDQPDMHARIQRELRTRYGDDSPKYGSNQVMEEYLKAKDRLKKSNIRTDEDEFNFIERGPGNVAGRTRAILVDPDDDQNLTWFAGSASGGIWKTSDGGESWSFKSGDIPNLGTNTLAMSAANSQVIYAGTGEHFTNDIDGAGMFKSTDKGNSWIQIADPSVFSDFKNVSRMVVSPNDENVVIATTRNSVWSGGLQAAIYKTINGGTTWTKVRSSTSERYDDIDYDPSDFNTLYVAVQGIGVLKSTDAGDTWVDSSLGMAPTGRVEITVSPVNSQRIWASVQGGLSGNASDLYVSNDGADTWSLAVESSENTNENFLGDQGWYDNIITGHPYDEDVVYVGGVNLWMFRLLDETITEINVLKTSQNSTGLFMEFVDFGGAYLDGGMDLGTVDFVDLLPVEIRFGQGTQLAHRFTVDGQGSGVPASGFLYQDYVEVPFQAWDTENNVQLMVSFRDQQEDGEWNLIEENTDGISTDHSREYFYIHKTTYSGIADPSIAQDGGVDNNQMYFFWPVLTSGTTFDPNGLPVSDIAITFDPQDAVEISTTSISDAYGEFDGDNSFPQSTRTSGIHPDQHNIIAFDSDDVNETFRLMVSNDGGVFTSVSATFPGENDGDFEYGSHGYNTTQFYGADKAPGENRFFGGMQDNGTWYHPTGTTGSADEDATFAIGGDGFETLWHSIDSEKLIGGSQFNNFRKTTNGGETWSDATGGFEDTGPFATRLTHHKSTPDTIFTLGTLGVWKSTIFGGGWSIATMNSPELWSFTNSADVEVSYANSDVIWAGGTMQSDRRLFVSTDGGATFNPSNNYEVFNMGSVSGIATDPSDDEVAFALFSFSGFPKVLKTSDQGQNWTDISGFDGTGNRGFPDVAVNCLFVFPDNTERIWVGSEIGIIETLDGGLSWNLLESNFPSVNVNDFKLVENQLVIATYGRGMWSVEVEGILIAPILKRGVVSPNGGLDFLFNFSIEFDSVLLYADGILFRTIFDNEIGDVNMNVQNTGLEGDIEITVEGYLEGGFLASKKNINVFQTNSISTSYGTDFSDAFNDFYGSGFSFNIQTGFINPALHSPHPYSGDTTIICNLRTPITVASSGATLKYEDVAIFQLGISGSSFPDENFFDYVVVEGTNDGENWIALEDGYDASLHANWLQALQEFLPVDRELFQMHSVNLLDHFEAGDNILIRFRLFSDALETDYGWVVDNLYIQEEPLAIIDEERKFSVYPNPIKGEASIVLAGEVMDNIIQVYSLQGKQVDQIKVARGQSVIKWNPQSPKKGIYILSYKVGNTTLSKKVLIQ